MSTPSEAEQPITCWHFIRADHTLKHGDGRIVRVGEVLSVEGELELCVYGLHASRRAFDAVGFTDNNALTVCRVECWGDMQEGDDKLVARYRKVLWMYDAEKVLHQFSVDAAREAMSLYAPDSADPKIQKANDLHHEVLNLKQRWISGELTDVQWAAARAAALAADAAWAAALARARARAAAISRLNARLESMLFVGAREVVNTRAAQSPRLGVPSTGSALLGTEKP